MKIFKFADMEFFLFILTILQTQQKWLLYYIAYDDKSKDIL